ncbi:flagellar basal-body MS-ring/collar protein FliF [Psychromarinibacter halotolerans]|uniref:Flagellar M-ring protein n=1 Tax=Psychromarinibacter halotolerans TaxID=1775175 RepID=A0ABV7GNQ4_9RHOB|nr:flagellar basal-body MS-ring/collar protein FliF [Psychromarinibacter halotolerans]MDF0595798.1 flagellar basal-body MS-ring/collar protein FliF [Psychromarinibacter halotolerans]
MNELIENLKGLGRRRLMLMGLTAVGLVLALVVGLSVAMSPKYRPLAMDIPASDASRMMTELEQAGFSPRISADGTMLSLPEDEVARARMALAEAGLPAEGNAGWELFDQNSGLGMNSFLQQINRLRALEGELARSIETIDNVDTARVHLVLPDRETFSQERPEPSASVVIHTRRTAPLERSQALAIRSLVAAAVPRLSPDRITILDGAGQAILSEEDLSEGNGLNSARAEIEERLRQNVESILAAHVGTGNVRVRVTADLDTSREVVVQESFDPDQQVPRSIVSVTEQNDSADSSSSTVDVANNLPGIDNGGGGVGRSETNTSSRDESVFEIGNTRSELIREPGAITRLSVAVVVNGTWDENGAYTPRTPEDLERLTALVHSAAGIDEERGDVVTVENLSFVAGDPTATARERSGFMDVVAMNFGAIVRALAAVVVVALLLFFGVRPLMRSFAASTEAAAEGDATADAVAIETPDAETPAAAGTPGAPGEQPRPKPMAEPVIVEEEEEFVSLASVSGNVMRRHIDELTKLIEVEPEGSLRIIRSWINQKS